MFVYLRMSILHESQTHRLRSNSPRNIVRTEQCTEISRFRKLRDRSAVTVKLKNT